ncbi:MAG: flagellar biosynthesis protein FliQ [Buchnera aphidicola (Periphyllus acericola)]|uniref:flagellar biosynthesis protein FliQ n=1 Tax=Buchnera aphidicola TaxID=9 RepID=UPI0030CD1C75|nr:flagellar biosynthesis protein FliQ [Buchnera aphidicola (Periphyllus acericola)]
MISEFLENIFFDASKVLFFLATPILFSVLLSGLIISIFQAVTQINEQTLSFIPKIISIFLVLFVLGPWMLELIVEYIHTLFLKIPMVVYLG